MTFLDDTLKLVEWIDIGTVEDVISAEHIEDHCYQMRIPLRRTDLEDGRVAFQTISKYAGVMEEAIGRFNSGDFQPTEIDFSTAYHGETVPNIDHIHIHGKRHLEIRSKYFDKKEEDECHQPTVRVRGQYDFMFITLAVFFALLAFYIFIEKFIR